MRFFRNLQFAQIRQTAGKTVVALAFMLVMLGSMFSVSAFAQAPSALAKPTARTQAVQSVPKVKGCFPDNAFWTWVSPDGEFQAWMGNFEQPKHFNFHVSPLCASFDTANYHISYNGNSIWKSYDSVANVTAYYGDSNLDACSSLYDAVNSQLDAAKTHVYTSDQSSLVNSAYEPLWEMMNEEIGGVCG